MQKLVFNIFSVFQRTQKMKSFKTIPLTVISEILKCLGGKLPSTVFSRIVSRGGKNYRTVRGIYPVHGFQDNL